MQTFKKVTTRMAGLVVLASGIFMATAAQGHNSLKESVPADGAVMHEAPQKLALTFTDSTYLEKVEITDAQGVNRLTGFSPSGRPGSQFSLVLPAGLEDGSYTVHWLVIGDDTHEIEGDFSFTVDAAAEEHAGLNHAEAGHHDSHAVHDAHPAP